MENGRLDHREFVAALPRGLKKELTRKSDGRGLLALGIHLGGTAFLAALIAVRVPFWPVLLVPQGILIIFLFTTLHETIHRTAFKTPWINDTVARLCGFVILLPADWFRYFHFAHHRHTQDPERDPELTRPKPRTWRQYLWHLSGLPVWAWQVKTLVSSALGRCTDPFVPASVRPDIATEARLMLLAYGVMIAGSLLTGSALLIFVWALPAVLGQPFLRLYLLAEHGRCALAVNMFENSRTTFTNRLLRRLAWNMPYHAEHHVFPAVPFHQLPRFHALTRKHLAETENGYRRFHAKYARALDG
jgi:fatty acid desaturase